MEGTDTVLRDKNGNVIRNPTECKCCGEMYDADIHYTCSMKEGECFTCWHWRSLLEDDTKEPLRVAIVAGHHYIIGDEPVKGYPQMLGFGGSKFIIRFHDGRIVTTHNLWHQGEITPYWRAKFPNNAEFVW